MPSRKHRTGSYKRKAKKTQTGVHVQRKRKRDGKARCGCGRPLNSVKRSDRSTSKSSKISNRPYGGTLCPVCARERALELARKGSRS